MDAELMQQRADHLCAMMESRERERGQWVRELQHEMAQTLTALRCHLAVIQRSSDDTVLARARQADELVDELVHWLRDLTVRVRPPILDDLGLGPTLTWYTNQLEQTTGRRVHLSLQGLDARLSYMGETAGFRAVAALLPELLGDEPTSGVQLHVAVQGEMLWLFLSHAGLVAEEGPFAAALDEVRSWVAWMEGTVRVEHDAGVTNVTVMIPDAAGHQRPAVSPTGE
jgi:glucose-6-phosphate-specific signal transduction histidine kinase